MRRFPAILLFILLLVTLCACGSTAPETSNGSEVTRDMPSLAGSLTASGNAEMGPGSYLLRSNAGDDGAQIVWYGEQNWYVIGYNGEGNEAAAKEDVITLFHVTAEEQTPFGDASGNTYKGSAMESYLGSLATDDSRAVFKKPEQKAIVPRQLEGGSGNYGADGYDDSKVKGDSVTAALWPLSAAEESAMPSSIATVGIGSSWWLRSPGGSDADVQTVSGDGTVNANGTSAAQPAGIRPAFDLDLRAVLLTSSAEGGKHSGAEGPDALEPIGTNAVGEWKLTLLDDGTVDGLSGHSGFAAGSVSTCDGMTLRIGYSGAVSGPGEYISALILDGAADATWYGRIAGVTSSSGSVTLNVDGKLSDGDTLFIFNEQYNGDRKTDYSSALNKIAIPAGADHNWVEATCTEPRTCSTCGATEGEPLGHTWVDATCTEPKTCSVCGATEGDPLGHDWIAVSCTEPRTCSVCGAMESEPPGHTWTEATCTEPRTCSVCGATEGEPLGHTWVDATCTEARTCSVCHITEGEPLGHTPGPETKDNEKEATCEGSGSYDSVVICSVCHEEISRETKEIPALGHAWDDGRITKEPTCEEEGVKTFTCGNDSSHTKEEDIAALGHDWDAGRITKEPTCEEKGIKIFTCRIDSSHTKEEDIAALGHDWDDGRITKEPTCEEKGEKTITCRNDSAHTKKEELAALGHKWDDGKISKESTCEEKGERTFTCQNDSTHTRKEEIEALGHDWSEWKVTREPTTEAKGERARVCSRCEKKETEEIDVLKGYKVTFDTKGGSAVAAQTVAENKTVTKPKDPEKEGFTFTGWFADSECKTAYDFTRPVTADITVYAGWKEKENPVAYTIIEGADGTWEKGSRKSYTIRVRRSEDDGKCFDHYRETFVDGKQTTVYAASGSTIVILSPDSLEKLTVGAHTVTIRFDDGEAVAYLTIREAAPPFVPDDTEPPADPDAPDDSETPDDSKKQDDPETPDTPDDGDGPNEPDEPVAPDEPDDPGASDRRGGSPLLWLIAIPVVLAGGGAGFLLGRKRGRK